MIIIPQDEFIKARNEEKRKIDDVFFVNEIFPVMIKQIKLPYYSIILKAIQTLGNEAIFLQCTLYAENSEDIPYLENHVLNQRNIERNKKSHEFAYSELKGINGDCTYATDFNMVLNKDDTRYHKCTAIRSTLRKDTHDEIDLLISKDNFVILSLFLAQITNRIEFLRTFTNAGFKRTEFIKIPALVRNSSCIVDYEDGRKFVMTHYKVELGPKVYGFAFLDDYDELRELNNPMDKKDWEEWYKGDPIITNVVEDKIYEDDKLVDVLDIVYPITVEVEDKGQIVTIDKPYKILQIKKKDMKLLTIINPDVIYKK